jgi:hypothetical protein|tara:strand:- start:679 stop:1014 length:336 start_codon:yes stop_codon:yes gene_type:complete
MKNIDEAQIALHKMVHDEFLPILSASHIKRKQPVLLVVFSTLEDDLGSYEFKIGFLDESTELDIVNDVKNSKSFHSIITQFRMDNMKIYQSGRVIGELIVSGESFHIKPMV